MSSTEPIALAFKLKVVFIAVTSIGAKLHYISTYLLVVTSFANELGGSRLLIIAFIDVFKLRALPVRVVLWLIILAQLNQVEHLDSLLTICFRSIGHQSVHLLQLLFFALVSSSAVIVPSRLFFEQGTLLVVK